MKTNGSETRYKRVWYGANTRVTIGPGFLHKTGFRDVVIPHPPVANGLLRLGLPGHLSRDLIFAHEFAHFQTAPVLFAYMFVISVLIYVKGRTSMGEILFLLVSVQATWEIMSESFVMLENSALYRKSYDRVTKLPRILFWAAGGILTAAGWVVVLHK
ncbi:MAG: hypothetical protein ABIG67_04650 [Pseudomonadota bacterium]|nr:hypothetical protein [Patescibacteria group bacterium]